MSVPFVSGTFFDYLCLLMIGVAIDNWLSIRLCSEPVLNEVEGTGELKPVGWAGFLPMRYRSRYIDGMGKRVAHPTRYWLFRLLVWSEFGGASRHPTWSAGIKYAGPGISRLKKHCSYQIPRHSLPLRIPQGRLWAKPNGLGMTVSQEKNFNNSIAFFGRAFIISAPLEAR